MSKRVGLCLSLLFLIGTSFSANVMFEPPDIRITNNSTDEYIYYGNGRSIIADQQGRIHVIWHYSNNIYYKRYTPGYGWSADTSLGTGGNSAAMAIDPTGRIHVCAYYSTYYIYYKSCMPVGTGNAGWDGSWTVLGSSSDGYKYYPSVACTPDTHVHIVFYRYRYVSPTGYMLGYYEKIGSTWQSFVALDSNSGSYYHYYPCIAGGRSNNDLHITWYGYRPGDTTYYQVFYLHRGSAGWDTVEHVSEGMNYYNYMPTIDVNFRNGYPYIAWSGGPTSPYRKLVKYRNSSGWSEADTISEPGSSYYQYYGQITAMKDGSMHNVWYGYSATAPSYYQIRYVGSDTLGMTWTTPVQEIRDDGAFYTYYPEIACSDSLDCFAFWYDGRNSPYELYGRLGQAPKPNDVGVINISVFPPYTVVQGIAQPMTIMIKNFGTNTQTAIPIAYLVSGRLVSETWTGTLYPGDTVIYTFSTTWVPSMVGQIPIKAWTSLGTEQWRSNDTCQFTADVFVPRTKVGQLFNEPTFPPPGWDAQITVGSVNWERVTVSSYPSGYSPCEGAGMARYNCYSAYPPAGARLWTHSFDVGTNPQKIINDFWILHGNYFSYSYDSVYIEYSLDSTNWTRLSGYRVYDGMTPHWVKHTDTIGDFPANQKMWIALNAKSDYYNDVYIDSVRTYVIPDPSLPNDVGIDHIQPFPKPMIAGSSYPVTVQIRNYELSEQTFIPVYYDPGDGSGLVQDTFIGLLPGPPYQDTVYFTFSQPYTPANQGNFDFKSWTGLVNDLDTTNDTTTMSIMVCPLFHTTPFFRDFEEAWGPYGDNPPFCGWRIAYDGIPQTNDWHKASGGWPIHNTAYAALLCFPYEDPSYDSLISPRFNFTGQADVILSCSTYWNPYDTGYLAEIKGSTDDGATYPYTIRTYPRFGARQNIYETFSLPWAADQANVRIAWIGNGNTYDFDAWFVDDVLITSGPLIRDVGVTRILAPSGIIDSGVTIVPQVKVKNYGNVSSSFPVWFKIQPYNNLMTANHQLLTVYQGITAEKNKPINFLSREQTADNDMSKDQVYEDSLWLTLAANDSAIIDFDSWIATEPDTYRLESFTALPEDMYPLNDSAHDSVFVRTIDAGINRIIAPAGIIDSGSVVMPQAVINNFGNTIISFPVIFKIGDFYADTINITNLNPYDSTTVNFRSWTVLERGTQIIKCTTALISDMNPINDFISDSVIIRVMDVGVYSIIAPSGIIDSGAIVVPQVKVKNYGNVSSSFPVWFKIQPYNNLLTANCQRLTVYHEKTDESNKIVDFLSQERTADNDMSKDQVYEDSVWLTLLANDSAIIDFGPWIPALLDTYHLESFSTLSGDMNSANDSAYGSVIVMRPFHDVGVISILAPTDTVDSGAVVIPKALVQNFGTISEIFPVRFKIGDFYTDAALITLPAGTVDTVEFMPWTAIQIGIHILKCTTLLTGDTNPSNNFLIDSVIVQPRVGIYEPVNFHLLPKSYALENCIPNPFKDQTIIKYALQKKCQINLTIYNSSGFLIRKLKTGDENEGYYKVIWNGNDDKGNKVAKGIYFYRIETDGFIATKKMVKLE